MRASWEVGVRRSHRNLLIALLSLASLATAAVLLNRRRTHYEL